MRPIRAHADTSRLVDKEMVMSAQREVDGVRRRHRRRRPGRPGVRDPPEAAQARHPRLRDREGVDDRRADPVRRGDRTAAAERIAARVGQESAADLRAGDEGRILVAARSSARDQVADHAAADAQPRQLHRVARRAVRVAGAAGRGARRRDLSGFRRSRAVLQRRRLRRRRAHRRHGRGQGRFAQARLHAGHRHQGADHGARRRLPRST